MKFSLLPIFMLSSSVAGMGNNHTWRFCRAFHPKISKCSTTGFHPHGRAAGKVSSIMPSEQMGCREVTWLICMPCKAAEPGCCPSFPRPNAVCCSLVQADVVSSLKSWALGSAGHTMHSLLSALLENHHARVTDLKEKLQAQIKTGSICFWDLLFSLWELGQISLKS